MSDKKRPDFIVADIETDPFRDWSTKAEQFVPKPFCCGVFDGRTHRLFWGADCIPKMLRVIRRIGGVCYFHNGGNFDFHFMLRYIDAPRCEFTRVGGKRIVRIVLSGKRRTELRDSYALVPRPLKAWAKDAFDYADMEADRRESRREAILEYLRGDLRHLFDLVSAARARNQGDPLTLASASFAKLRRSTGRKFETLSEHADEVYRKFYYAGRVLASVRGRVRGRFECYDINSAFPHAMLDRHAWGSRFRVTLRRPSARVIPRCFVEITARARGCFPVRTPEGVDFSDTVGTFYVTGWEYAEAMRLGLVSDIKSEVWHVPAETVSYRDFVLPLHAEKLASEKSGDAAGRLFSKLEMNSAYGKTGQNPRKFEDVLCRRIGEFPRLRNGKVDTSWTLANDDEENGLSFFTRPSHGPGRKPLRFYNVAVAASITGYVRARLMRVIHENGAIYADTDSVFVPTGRTKGMEIGNELGQWKHEFTFKRLWIAGKKFYAGEGTKPGERTLAWKIASKGVRLTPQQIVKVAEGEEVVSRFAAPSFSVVSGTRFIERRSRRRPI